MISSTLSPLFLTLILLSSSLISQCSSHPPDSPHNHTKANNTNNHTAQIFVEDGKLCKSEIMQVEETEYDERILCRVKMADQCEETYQEEVCHTAYTKDCEITYLPKMTKIRVKVCPEKDEQSLVENRIARKLNGGQSEPHNSLVMDIRPTPKSMDFFTENKEELKDMKRTVSKCKRGYRSICESHFETECHTVEVEHHMMEDRPMCKVEMMEKCKEPEEKENEHNPMAFLEKIMPKKKKDKICHKVPAMRCKIEPFMVKKMKPETKCDRVPRRFCHKEQCHEEEEEEEEKVEEEEEQEEEDENCYIRMQTVNEMVPEEQCKFVPRRVCHPVLRKRKSLFHSAPEVERFLRRRHSEEEEQLRSAENEAGNSKFGKRKQNGGGRKSTMKCYKRPMKACETQKLNPRPVVKEMVKKSCQDM